MDDRLSEVEKGQSLQKAQGRTVSDAPKTGLGGWLWGRHSFYGLLTALLVGVLDQFHKWWMLAVIGIQENERIKTVLPFMDLVFAKNPGISFSLLDWDSVYWQWCLAGFAVLVSSFLWVWLVRGANSLFLAVSLGLIIGGAVSNAIDRLHLGGVADFIVLHAYSWKWYAFNVADVAIVAGAIGLLYEFLVLSRNDAANGS